MESFARTYPAPHPDVEARPTLSSYDSNDECSLDHWLEVYWLVEDEYIFAKDADAEVVK